EGIDPSVEIIKPPGDFEEVTIPTWGRNKPQCLRRLAMFRRDAAQIFGERFVCMDIDCVVAGDLDPVFDVPNDLKIYGGNPHPRRPYAGGMMLLTAGARPHVYEKFSPDAAALAGRRFLGSDQAWLSAVLAPGEATWGPEDGVVWYGIEQPHAENCRVMFFHGTPKPDQMVLAGDEWVSRHYRAEPRGRCLMLGYAETVWDDALAAYAQYGRFDAVIISPEVAEHWTGPVLAVVADEDRAERVAAMHGYEPVWCGRASAEAMAA
ncbi:MAG TPA: hypothetical protein VHN11_11535, partial [Xanthobacteraceae bacterium]|nr:hypothetical protein [Xanthobacteraceae bacterium]